MEFGDCPADQIERNPACDEGADKAKFHQIAEADAVDA